MDTGVVETASALADQPWPAVADGPALLAVPVGATEQHGPHLPLGTDTDIAAALARRLAERVPDVLVAPALPYGSSGEHQGFPGTLSIGQSAVELVLVELGRSATETFSRIVFVCGHGGNAQPVARAVRQLQAEGRDACAWAPSASWRGDAHAGRTETSIMLALHPDRVELPLAAAGDPRPLPELMPALRAGGVIAVSPNGVLGDPTGASAAEGARLLATAADDLAAAVLAWPGAGTAWL
jgi:mycofactocin precursor peptide peptidase